MESFIHDEFLLKILKENHLTIDLQNTREFICLKSIFQLQLMSLVETAIKFMNSDKREKLQQDDIIGACQENNHLQYIFGVSNTYDQHQNSKTIIQASEFIEQEIIFLKNNQINDQSVTGRWLVVNNKIPHIARNQQITSYRQIKNQKTKELEKGKILASIIKDKPKDLLTNQESTYYQKITSIIGKDSNPKERFRIEGDLSNLIPFFIKYFCQNGVNQTGINFLLSLIQIKPVWFGIQYFLNLFMNLLLTYEGPHAFEVGIKISQLVLRFQSKYPKLRDIYQTTHLQINYSNILKKIPFSFYYDVIFDLNQQFLNQMLMDCQKNVEIAIICFNALQSYSNLLMLNIPQTHNLNQYKFWHPISTIKLEDPYLMMII